MTPHLWYVVEVTAADGKQLDNSMCGSLEIARRAVARFRALYPDAEWITVNRQKRGTGWQGRDRVTALHAMTVHRGTTAQERRAAASVTGGAA